jgi:hypothetical protein
VFEGIYKDTFAHWKRIYDNEELFLTNKRPAGRPKMSTPADDQQLREKPLANNWHNFNQLRQTEAIQTNERLRTMSNQTMMRRLRSSGKF